MPNTGDCVIVTHNEHVVMGHIERVEGEHAYVQLTRKIGGQTCGWFALSCLSACPDYAAEAKWRLDQPAP